MRGTSIGKAMEVLGSRILELEEVIEDLRTKRRDCVNDLGDYGAKIKELSGIIEGQEMTIKELEVEIAGLRKGSISRFKVGDRVSNGEELGTVVGFETAVPVEFDISGIQNVFPDGDDELSLVTPSKEPWNKLMDLTVGKIEHLLDEGDVRVRTEDGIYWTYPVESLELVEPGK